MAEASSIEMRRHCRELSPGEIDELVGIVADLIVEFLKKRDPKQTDSNQMEIST